MSSSTRDRKLLCMSTTYKENQVQPTDPSHRSLPLSFKKLVKLTLCKKEWCTQDITISAIRWDFKVVEVCACSSDFRSIKKQSDRTTSTRNFKLLPVPSALVFGMTWTCWLMYLPLCNRGSSFKLRLVLQHIFNFVLLSVSSTLHALAAWAHACGKIWGKIGIWLHKYFKVRHTLHYPDQGSLAVVRLEVRGLP